MKAVGYPLKHRAIAWVSKNLFDGVTYTVRNGLNKGLRRKGGLGWVPVDPGVTPEIRFWQSLDLANKVVYDVGAFHGILTLFFAQRARHVVAFEPNSHNRRRMIENLQLNGFKNVTIRPYGLSFEAASAQMSFDPLAPGTASVDSQLKAEGAQQETIELRPLDAEVGLEPPDLIKVDVEGFELAVLQGARQALARKPELFLEMHGADAEDKRRRVQAIVDHLWEAGYRRVEHVESGSQVTPENAAVAARGHLYVRP